MIPASFMLVLVIATNLDSQIFYATLVDLGESLNVFPLQKDKKFWNKWQHFSLLICSLYQAPPLK